ncbi:hypothetical protein WAI76_22230, partial [Acinetobacter baumannii]
HPSTVTFIVPPHLPLPQVLIAKVYLVAFRIVGRKGGFGVVGQHWEIARALRNQLSFRDNKLSYAALQVLCNAKETEGEEK